MQTLYLHRHLRILWILALIGFLGSLLAAEAESSGMNPEQIAADLKKSADWQLANPLGTTPVTDWVIAPLYDGLLRLSLTTGDARYLTALLQFGTQAGWMPHSRLYHADDVAVGHAWLDLYSLDRSRVERLAPMKARLDAIVAAPVLHELDFRYPKKVPGVHVSDRWTWCDALYMAPPTYVRMYRITGDKKYLGFMDREFRFAYDSLWDAKEKLFYRDATFLDKKAPNGRPVFWSRGNGWVYGGLALVLEQLPKEHPTYDFYVQLYREMTSSILASQQPDGLWTPSLLDPSQVPVGETSGSAFFVFGLAWGVNQGLLDRATYWPVIERGWKGLMTRVKSDGYVGFVQRIGAAPDDVNQDSRQDYGTGAFLLAGSEVIRALGGAKPPLDMRAFLALAEDAAELKTPRAYARLLPERKDDLAWENDKVAFRIYGPALKDSIEDSGVDLWCKRVPYPIINKWYALDLAGKQSYHKDHGEGYDTFKVADSRGCGGLGIWVGEKLVISDVYQSSRVYNTRPEEASFRVSYRYPAIGKLRVEEIRHITLRMGEQLYEATSRFHVDGGSPSSLLIAVGLLNQTEASSFVMKPEKGVMAVWDRIDGEGLGTGVVFVPGTVADMKQIPFGTDRKQTLGFVRPDAGGSVRYRAGFAWSKAGDIKTLDEWTALLLGKAGTPLSEVPAELLKR